MDVPCFYCKEPVDANSGYTYQGIHGWERMGRYSGRKGGGSDIAAREKLQEWAHPDCVKKLKRGLDPTQGSLL